jgi:hypothetical protein
MVSDFVQSHCRFLSTSTKFGLRKKLMDGGHLAAGEAGNPAKK